MKKLLLPAVIFVAIALFHFVGGNHTPALQGPSAAAQQANSDIARAFEAHSDGVQVEGRGEVVKILGDDNDGTRHQRFIVRLTSGLTILIAHNIDLASRISPMNVGDKVSFSGEYAWNPKGGVVHWTHRDPRGNHVAGWIKHDGQLVQ